MASTNRLFTSGSALSKECASSIGSQLLNPCRVNDAVTQTRVENQECRNQREERGPNVQSYRIEKIERTIQNSTGIFQRENLETSIKTTPRIQKQSRKNVAPRFVSSITGMIVDQGSDIVLEGIIDGYPPPRVYWRKNGQDIEGINMTFKHNHVHLELKNVNVRDAGRYTCIAENQLGEASSTADLIVKKTIFPPVFGKRLQAQIAKRGDRVIMEVEITGTPEPIVTWYKNDEPLMDVDGKLKRIGNCFFLVIEEATKNHAGKYMVNASNLGGEAQSIADFVVFEPTPDTMVENHKTIIYENVADKDLKPAERKDVLPSAALTAEHIATTKIKPSSTLKTVLPTTNSPLPSTICKIELVNPESTKAKAIGDNYVNKNVASRAETSQSIIQTQNSETKQEQQFYMKVQHQTETDSTVDEVPVSSIYSEQASTDSKTSTLQKTNYKAISRLNEQKNVNIDDVEISALAKKEAIKLFESLTNDSGSTSTLPGEISSTTGEEVNKNYDVKVDKSIKCYKKSLKFDENQQPSSKLSSTKLINAIPKELEFPMNLKDIDDIQIDFPFEEYKLSKFNIQKTLAEETTASGSPIHGTLTISRLVAQSESAEEMLTSFNLTPGPPPKIDDVPKPSRSLNMLSSEFQTIPSATLNFFPPSEEKNVPYHCSSPDSQKKTNLQVCRNVSDYIDDGPRPNLFEHFSASKPSADGLAMEKCWAKKCIEKSWPPTVSDLDSTQFITIAKEWKATNDDLKNFTHEKREIIEGIRESTTKTDESLTDMMRLARTTEDKTLNLLTNTVQPGVLQYEKGDRNCYQHNFDGKNINSNKNIIEEKKKTRDLYSPRFVNSIPTKSFHEPLSIFKGTSATAPKRKTDPCITRSEYHVTNDESMSRKTRWTMNENLIEPQCGKFDLKSSDPKNTRTSKNSCFLHSKFECGNVQDLDDEIRHPDRYKNQQHSNLKPQTSPDLEKTRDCTNTCGTMSKSHSVESFRKEKNIPLFSCSSGTDQLINNQARYGDSSQSVNTTGSFCRGVQPLNELRTETDCLAFHVPTESILNKVDFTSLYRESQHVTTQLAQPTYMSTKIQSNNCKSHNQGTPCVANSLGKSSAHCIQPYLDKIQPTPPVFTTPLKDIAVLTNQSARFECIVRAEPQPNIFWFHDEMDITNSFNFEVYYRNGICRLILPCANYGDSGTYTCLATNRLGSASTSSSLHIPCNKRSIY